MTIASHRAMTASPRPTVSIPPLKAGIALLVPAIRTQVTTRGYYSLTDIFREELAAGVTEEALRQRPLGTRMRSASFYLNEAGRYFASPMRFVSSPPGPFLRYLHHHPQTLRLVNAVAAQKMRPTTASYNYYRGGSYIGLHTELPACQLVLIVAAIGAVPPLLVYPQLRGLTPADLLRRAKATAGAPPGGIPLRIPRRGFAILRGRRTPHRRALVRTGDRTIGVGTLCYRAQVS